LNLYTFTIPSVWKSLPCPTVNPRSSLKPSLNIACLCYEDFVRSSAGAFSIWGLILSASLSSPTRLQNPSRHKLSYFFVYSQPHKDYSAPVTTETQKASIQYMPVK